jgi:hypothetical protein
MHHYPPKGSLERGAARDLWRNTLSQIPSVFGRLVYLCSLRDANSGQYQHFGLAQAFGDEEADKVLRASHEQAFSEWLCFTLEQQKADLDSYLSSLDGNRKTILDTWIRLAPYRTLAPSKAREVERQLYLTDLETILELLRSEYGVVRLDPDE